MSFYRTYHIFLMILLFVVFNNTSIWANTYPQRAYNLILAEGKTGKKVHTYVLLGLEGGKRWNLLGGKRDPGDKTLGATAARELYEESGTFFDKRRDIPYWSKLPTYEYGSHKVFIHKPGNLSVNLTELDTIAVKNLMKKSLPSCYREMHKFQVMRLSHLISLANSQVIRGEDGEYKHPTEGDMIIDGWALYTLNRGGRLASQFAY